MKIRNNKNLKLDFPGGSYGEFDEFKTDYSNLVIKNVTRENEKKLRFDVRHGNNMLSLYLHAETEEGRKDLQIIEENKEKIIGEEVESVIGLEL